MPNYGSYKNWICINKLWILHLLGFKYSLTHMYVLTKFFLSIIFFECLSFSHHCLLSYWDDNYGFTQKKTVLWCFFSALFHIYMYMYMYVLQRSGHLITESLMPHGNWNGMLNMIPGRVNTYIHADFWHIELAIDMNEIGWASLLAAVAVVFFLTKHVW